MPDLRLVLQCLKGEVTYHGQVDSEVISNKRGRHKSDNLIQYEDDIEEMNLILISIPIQIYNSVDLCQTAKEMWLQVKRLMQGTELSEIMNDLKRNKIELPTVTINTKFLNCLQPKGYNNYGVIGEVMLKGTHFGA
ncbi:hypothetical protein Tco_0519322 [Tanacetum coccineum]